MNRIRRKLSLYPATYQIKVPGKLDDSWVDWAGDLTVTADCEGGDQFVTTLTGTIDQAALLGLLRRLYSLGLPLISVNWIEEKEVSAGPEEAYSGYRLDEGKGHGSN